MRSRPLILASASPRRKLLLKRLKVPFRALPSGSGESSKERRPSRLVLALALRKALKVARKAPRALVLGADTVVVCRGEILGKPKSAAHGRRILDALNGRWHRVYTGVALVDSRTGRSWKEYAVSRVKARRLDPAALARMAGRHLDKAGAYAVQDRADPFIERIIGPADNVVGLPLHCVRNLLAKASRSLEKGR